MDEDGPPTSVTLDLEEALELLASLETARATFRESGHFAGLLEMEVQVRMISRRLGFAEGGWDGDDL